MFLPDTASYCEMLSKTHKSSKLNLHLYILVTVILSMGTSEHLKTKTKNKQKENKKKTHDSIEKCPAYRRYHHCYY